MKNKYNENIIWEFEFEEEQEKEFYESKGVVLIKKLFTYDVVIEYPGCSAKMEYE